MGDPPLANAAQAALNYIRLAINKGKIEIVTDSGHPLMRSGEEPTPL